MNEDSRTDIFAETSLGITQAKQKIARTTGIPMSKAGIERKIGSTLLKMIFKKK